MAGVGSMSRRSRRSSAARARTNSANVKKVGISNSEWWGCSVYAESCRVLLTTLKVRRRARGDRWGGVSVVWVEAESIMCRTGAGGTV